MVDYTTYSTTLPVSCQQFYNNNSTSSLSAILTFFIDDNLNALYINNVNIISYNQYTFGTYSKNITFLPGNNILDFHCQNAGGTGGLTFYVTNTAETVLLTQSDANVSVV